MSGVVTVKPIGFVPVSLHGRGAAMLQYANEPDFCALPHRMNPMHRETSTLENLRFPTSTESDWLML
jgi:hypothetical protein